MLVGYRKVNSNIVLDSFPMLTIDHAFEQLGGAVVFFVFDLNSTYNQIPLSVRSRRLTAFCTPFALFEFNKLPMGISEGSQVLIRVIDELFADLKGKLVFNFLDDLIVYSPSMEEHMSYVRKVLSRLKKSVFTLNPDKRVDGQLAPLSYYSRLLSPAERGYSTMKRSVWLCSWAVINAECTWSTKNSSSTVITWPCAGC